MDRYTLWALSEPLGNEVLLAVEREGAQLAQAVLARDPASIQRFIAERGMPRQIAANVSTAVRLLREAEPRLYQVPASILKPKELTGPLVALVLRAYET